MLRPYFLTLACGLRVSRDLFLGIRGRRKRGEGGGKEGNVTLKSPLRGIHLAETYIPAHSYQFFPLVSSPMKTGRFVWNVFKLEKTSSRDGYIYRIVLIEYSN